MEPRVEPNFCRKEKCDSMCGSSILFDYTKYSNQDLKTAILHLSQDNTHKYFDIFPQ